MENFGIFFLCITSLRNLTLSFVYCLAFIVLTTTLRPNSTQTWPTVSFNSECTALNKLNQVSMQTTSHLLRLCMCDSTVPVLAPVQCLL